MKLNGVWIEPIIAGSTCTAIHLVSSIEGFKCLELLPEKFIVIDCKIGVTFILKLVKKSNHTYSIHVAGMGNSFNGNLIKINGVYFNFQNIKKEKDLPCYEFSIIFE